MSAKSESIVKSLLESIQSPSKETSPYDTQATVIRVEDDTVFVHIPGGVAETPCSKTISCKVGDTVQVRVGGGKAWLVGNASAPPTDDTTANTAIRKTNQLGDSLTKLQKIAGNTDQYFWHVETGEDTGSHITEIPKERFLEAPALGGGNLLLRSNGIAIRDGLNELATFSSSAIQFNQPGTSTVVATIGSNGLYIQKGIIKIGQKESASDTTHTGFYVDVNGNVAASNLLATGGKIGGWNISGSTFYAYGNENGSCSAADALGYTYVQGAPGTNLGNTVISVRTRTAAERTAGTDFSYQFYVDYKGYLYANNANIKGTVTATSGTIGGFSIGSTQLSVYGTASGVGTSSNGLYWALMNGSPGTNGGNVAFGVASRTSTSASWVFNTYMNYNGYFYAKNANIQGTITSSSGTIGGWTISSNGMFYPNATTPNAWITSSSATFGNGNYNVTTGRIPGPSSSAFYGIEGEPDHALTIGNGVTWLQLGCNGEWLRPNDSGTCSLGNSDYKWTRVYATNGTIQTSDRKDKDVLGDLDEELATNLILNANPITYMWKDGDHRRTRMGFIAQEIAEECKAMNKNLALCTASFKGDPAFSDSGSDIARDYFGEDVDDSELTWGLAYTELIAPLVKVVQIQHDNIQTLTSRMAELEARLNG